MQSPKTDSKEWGPENSGHSADQEVICHLWNQKVHYRVQEIQPMNPNMGHMKQGQAVRSHTF
jgi:hypothetical protein